MPQTQALINPTWGFLGNFMIDWTIVAVFCVIHPEKGSGGYFAFVLVFVFVFFPFGFVNIYGVLMHRNHNIPVVARIFKGLK